MSWNIELMLLEQRKHPYSPAAVIEKQYKPELAQSKYAYAYTKWNKLSEGPTKYILFQVLNRHD
jgi:hypothetical protein